MVGKKREKTDVPKVNYLNYLLLTDWLTEVNSFSKKRSLNLFRFGTSDEVVHFALKVFLFLGDRNSFIVLIDRILSMTFGIICFFFKCQGSE